MILQKSTRSGQLPIAKNWCDHELIWSTLFLLVYSVAFSSRVTLDHGTPYLMLWSFFLYFYAHALSHNETGLGFSAEQRVLPLCLKMYYELFTYSETLEIHGRVPKLIEVLGVFH